MNSKKMKEAIAAVGRNIAGMSYEELRTHFDNLESSWISESLEHSGFFDGNQLVSEKYPKLNLQNMYQSQHQDQPKVSIDGGSILAQSIKKSYEHYESKLKNRWCETKSPNHFMIAANDGVDKWAA